jgi:hypothetical protein
MNMTNKIYTNLNLEFKYKIKKLMILSSHKKDNKMKQNLMLFH